MKCTVKNNISTPMMSELFDKRNLNLPISHKIFETNSSFHVK